MFFYNIYIYIYNTHILKVSGRYQVPFFFQVGELVINFRRPDLNPLGSQDIDTAPPIQSRMYQDGLLGRRINEFYIYGMHLLIPKICSRTSSYILWFLCIVAICVIDTHMYIWSPVPRQLLLVAVLVLALVLEQLTPATAATMQVGDVFVVFIQ